MAATETAAHLVTEFAAGPAPSSRCAGCDIAVLCVIPYGRGPSRSVPMGAIVEQVRAWSVRLSRIVLTGVDITSYGPTCRGGRRSGR